MELIIQWKNKNYEKNDSSLVNSIEDDVILKKNRHMILQRLAVGHKFG